MQKGRGENVFDSPVDPGGSSSSYTALRSATPSNFTAAQCLMGSPQLNVLIDETVPAEGEVLYYLVRADSSCGPGPLGEGTGGLPRQGPLLCSVIGGLGCGPGGN